MKPEAAFRMAAQEYDPAIELDSISEHPDNPNKGAVGIIAESMGSHGFFGSILVQRSTRFILVGNHRFRQDAAAGAVTLPGFWLDVDDDEAASIMAVDNESGRLGSNDETKLLALLNRMTTLVGSGYSEDQRDDLARRLAAGLSRGDLLALAGVTVGEPRHAVLRGQVWTCGPHKLVIGDVFTGWPLWAKYLTEGVVFMPYPTPLAPHAPNTGPLLLVQPDLFLAAVLLDKWEDITGTAPVAELA